MTKALRILSIFVFMLAICLAVFPQARSKKGVVIKPAAKPIAADPTPSSGPQPPAALPAKRNGRPDLAQDTNEKSPVGATSSEATIDPPYFYEFSQPKFIITKITIKHDDNGKGSMTFRKGEFDDPITEAVQLSKATLDKINGVLTELDYLNSTENYQYEKDYSHLGNITFRLKKDGREREVHFNYTTNKNAKELADEYRRIGNQIIWIFDMNVARENQPLDAPRQMDALESYMQRNEIADPTQLVDFLKGLTDDERIPLIARNHAGKLIKQITKAKK